MSCMDAAAAKLGGCTRRVYLGEVVQRLDDISLNGELEQDELLGQPVLRLAAELQHLPAGAEHRGWRGGGGLVRWRKGTRGADTRLQ